MPNRRSCPAVLGLVALYVATACGPSVTSPMPVSPSGPSGSIPVGSAAVSPEVSTAAPSPSGGVPASNGAAGPSPSASASGPCPIPRQTVAAPSDRLVDLAVSSGASADVVSFVFGPSSLEGPPLTPTGTLSRATPPFRRAGSGSPVKVAGSRVARIVFTRLSTANDVGEPTYQGRADIRTSSKALREVVLYDESEGVVGWFIGFDGPGCATVTATGNRVTVTISHS